MSERRPPLPPGERQMPLVVLNITAKSEGWTLLTWKKAHKLPGVVNLKLW